MESAPRRAAVLGHPVAHSLSPVLHRAAYAALGLNWSYEAIDVDESELEGFLASLDDSWAGLSLTMPLKIEAARLAGFVEPQAKLLGTVNTLVASGLGEYRQWVGANTDIHGMVAAFAEARVTSCSRAVVIGGGATATSALAAVASLGSPNAGVIVRNKARAGRLMHAASKMGLQPRFIDMGSDEALVALSRAEVAVSTIPAAAGEVLADRLMGADMRVAGHLLDVVYSPVRTRLLSAWSQAGGHGISGTRMLLYQAAEQVRLMTGVPAPTAVMDQALGGALTA
ncbi:MAG: shikimate dehydrogenase [Actinobacteria bacterium HGW-Actinobacteria-8]|nr:MAG: shikimate dehydrogenase [Actinobacteria bacterium HGW-Actinobacteria-8]